MKKFFRYITFAMAALMSIACAEQEAPEEEIRISVEPKMAQFESAAAQKNLKVTSNGKWKAAVPKDAAWCSLDKMQGNGTADLVLSVQQNEGNRRSTIVTFQTVTGNKVQLTVIQTAGEAKPDTDRTGLFAVPELPDADKACTLYYGADTGSPFYDYSGELYAHIGLVDEEWSFVQAEWSENKDKCKFKKVKNNLWSLEIGPAIRDWFGSGENAVANIGVVVRNADGSKQTADLLVKVQDNKYQFVPDKVVEAPLPGGVKHGINYVDDHTVTFVFYDKDKNGQSHDYCYLIGDFSKWKRDSQYMMKWDAAAGCWWYTMTGLEAGKEYLFQYHPGYKQGASVRVSDPYTEIVYDTANDRYIPESTYPGLTPCPSEASGLISAFQTGNRSGYAWKTDGFKAKDQNNLVIYEMLLRDFTRNKDLHGALEKLDYLQKLGINAIELMPVQEFDGNLSWGYNPNHYFALDKAYGSRDLYKQFVDECHKRGIAVILDVVYNHVTILNPMAKLFSSGNKVAENNPWFNMQAPHPYSVFEDWNHENKTVREHVKRSLQYLLKEYRVDGFRFDLSKGLTQTSSTEATAGNYDAARVAILKDYHNAIVAENPDAITILEHFCCLREEKELAENGMKVWRNLNNAYCQSAMGYKENSGFEGLYTGHDIPFGAYVGFMESHDEERTAFKAQKYGTSSIKNSLSLRMKRAGLNAAFFLTVPGPKMIWQFGEMGYDVSIEEGGRTGEKPVRWEYLDVPERKALHDTYAGLLGFRNAHPEFFQAGASFEWKVGSNSWPIRTIHASAGADTFMVIGNFGDKATDVELNFSDGKTWKDYFAGKNTYQGAKQRIALQPGEFKLLVNF